MSKDNNYIEVWGEALSSFTKYFYIVFTLYMLLLIIFWKSSTFIATYVKSIVDIYSKKLVNFLIFNKKINLKKKYTYPAHWIKILWLYLMIDFGICKQFYFVIQCIYSKYWYAWIYVYLYLTIYLFLRIWILYTKYQCI